MADEGEDNTSWGEYRKLVISELERLSDKIEHLDTKIDIVMVRELTDMKIRISSLEIKVGLIGIMAGAFGSGAAEVIKYLINK